MAGSKPDTWMPMFWGDYLRDTGHLSTAQHGAYMLLIGHYWTTGKPIPDSDAVMGRITRQGIASWRNMREVIAAFFDIADGLWRHHRIEAELDRATRFIEKQAANGAKGGRPRNPTETQTYPNDKPKPKPEITTSPSPPNISSHGRISTDAASAPAPEGARPRSSGLTSDAEWRDRLEAYKPWLGERPWKPFWGPTPDAAGHQPAIPADLLRWWRAQAAQARQSAA